MESTQGREKKCGEDKKYGYYSGKSMENTRRKGRIMSSKNKKEQENYLDQIPRRKEEIHWECDDAGAVTIYRKNQGVANGIAQKLFRKPKVTQVHLDEMGNFIWPRIDGKRSVYELALLVKEEFGEKAEPLYDRLIRYLEILKDQGFVE